MLKSGVIGLAVAIGVGVTLLAAKKYAETPIGSKEQNAAEEPQSITSAVKERAMNGLKRAVAFAVTHIDEIQAFGTILGVVSTAVGAVVTIRDLREGEKRDRALYEIHDMLADIYNTEPLYHPVESPAVGYREIG